MSRTQNTSVNLVNILSSSANAKVFRREKISVRVGETHSKCSKLVQQGKITLLGTEAMAPNGPALTKLRDFLFWLFEKNDCCLKEENECGSNADGDPRINTSEKDSAGYDDPTYS